MSTKTITLPLGTALLEQLESHTRETGESRSHLVERLVEEGLRMEAHPGVVFRSGPAGRRPALHDGPDIWEVARVIRDVAARAGQIVGEVVRLTGLTPRQVRAAAGYYAAHREEIDGWIRRVDEAAGAAEAAWLRGQQHLAP